MDRLNDHPIVATVIALGLACAAVLGIAAAYGFDAFAEAWSRPDFPWLALVAGAGSVVIPAYLISYRTVARFGRDEPVPLPVTLRIVTAGFGPFATRGGFALDKHALAALEGDEETAAVRVLGLGALEWALLAPASWATAVALLATGDRRVLPSVLWPWAIAVPVGFVLALWLADSPRGRSMRARAGRWSGPIDRAFRAIGLLRKLAVGIPRCWQAWAGMALYWSLDIATFYASLRFVRLTPSLGEAILAYATGYALTRRSMPLGGAGITETMMTFALHWAGQPVAPALAAVVLYRLFNFLLPAIPAWMARGRIYPLITRAREGRRPVSGEPRTPGARSDAAPSAEG